VLKVADDGPGIPEELREVVFERYRRAHPDAERRYSGTGLGLAIAKEFVTLHGGTIAASRAPEGGALLRVELPAVADAPGPAPAPRPLADETVRQTLAQLRPPEALPVPVDAGSAGGSRPRVLVIEDNPEMRRFVAESLAKAARVLAAADGPEGLRMAAAHSPDVILCDVMMPGMTGEAVLAELKSRPETADIPVVMLTAKADDETRVHLLDAGAADFLNKPFGVQELLVRCRNLAAVRRASRALQGRLQTAGADLAGMAEQVAARNRELSDALDRLARSETRFRRLVESNVIGVITADLSVGADPRGQRRVPEDRRPHPGGRRVRPAAVRRPHPARAFRAGRPDRGPSPGRQRRASAVREGVPAGRRLAGAGGGRRRPARRPRRGGRVLRVGSVRAQAARGGAVGAGRGAGRRQPRQGRVPGDAVARTADPVECHPGLGADPADRLLGPARTRRRPGWCCGSKTTARATSVGTPSTTCTARRPTT
jgi:DNA-binding response OmpR family regulator